MHNRDQGGESRETPFVPTDQLPFFFTPTAVKAAEKALQAEGDEGDFLRLTMYPHEEVISPRYALDFESELRPGDEVFTFGGIKVVANPDTVSRLRGTVVDYITGPDGTGFQFNNPNDPRHKTWNASSSPLYGERETS